MFHLFIGKPVTCPSPWNDQVERAARGAIDRAFHRSWLHSSDLFDGTRATTGSQLAAIR
jgi:hypothetical protein